MYAVLTQGDTVLRGTGSQTAEYYPSCLLSCTTYKMYVLLDTLEGPQRLYQRQNGRHQVTYRDDGSPTKTDRSRGCLPGRYRKELAAGRIVCGMILIITHLCLFRTDAAARWCYEVSEPPLME